MTIVGFGIMAQDHVHWITAGALYGIGGVLMLASSLEMLKSHLSPEGGTPKVPETTASVNEIWSKHTEEIVGVAEQMRLAGAQAMLLWHFEARATDLENEITRLWHQWDNAGEKLVYPIGGQNEFRAWNTDKCWPLLNYLRDFKVLFGQHLMLIKLEFPGFDSSLLRYGYPSDRGYVDVLTDIKQHREKLGELGQSIWDRGTAEEALHGKKT